MCCKRFGSMLSDVLVRLPTPISRVSPNLRCETILLRTKVCSCICIVGTDLRGRFVGGAEHSLSKTGRASATAKLYLFALAGGSFFLIWTMSTTSQQAHYPKIRNTRLNSSRVGRKENEAVIPANFELGSARAYPRAHQFSFLSPAKQGSRQVDVDRVATYQQPQQREAREAEQKN